MTNQTQIQIQIQIQDKKQMMNHEQITAVLASDDPVQLKRLIAMLGWYGNSLLDGMEMRGIAADPGCPDRERLWEAASKIYLAANPIFETISNIVRPTEDESEALSDECTNTTL
ncbi:hypothetical protein [Aeromonas veronii]|uniref:hypothetical protein n=1 Tax=Aeromonas veronii TaxID=654 RepID=UPI003F799842